MLEDEELDELRDEIAVIEAELCRKNLKEFVQAAWKIVEGGNKLTWNWHLDLLCDELMAISRGEQAKLLVNVPPGTMKSLLVSVFWPAWEWTRDPSLKFFTASYGQDLATRDTMKMRDIVSSDWYRYSFGVKFRADQEQKPVWVGERVTTPSGFKRLGDVQVGDEVLTHTGRFRRVLAVHEQGVIPTVSVRTMKGRAVCAAPDHPFLTEHGWVLAGALAAGDKLVIPQTPAFNDTTGTVSDEEARLLGYLVGDGYISGRQTDVRFANLDPELRADFITCAKAVGFHAFEGVDNRLGYVTGVTLRPAEGKWNFNRDGVSPLKTWLEKHGVYGASSYTKRIPPPVLGGGNSALRNFIGAYWSCDGSISARPLSTGRTKYTAIASTVSEGLARDLHLVLTGLGVNCRLRRGVVRGLRTEKQPDEYAVYSVSSTLQESVAQFADFPITTRKRIHAEAARDNAENARGPRGNVAVPLDRDTVVEVRASDPVECRCLTVEDDSSFTAGGVAVHNTWFINTAGGWRVASSVGGRGTGEHPDRRIIDDPHSAQQARSDVERQAAIDWYDQTISTRGVTKNVREVLVMQRLHEQDLAGHLLEKGGWRHVMLPMRYESERSCVGDPREKDGELLWPELFPEEKVAALELALGEYGTAGQLQQRPAPIGGGLFKRPWFKIVEKSPANARRVRAWDVAGTEGGRGARTAGVRVADAGPGARPRFFVESVVKGRWGAFEVDQAIKGIASTDGQKVRIREEQEGGSAGKAVIAARARSLAGWDYSGVSATGDKETRANQFRTQAEAGEVALVAGAWNEEFLQEAEVFPNGRQKDQVDAAAHAFNELMTGARAARVGKVNWG